MQSLAYSSLVTTSVHLNVVLTKIDIVDDSPEKERAHKDFHGIVDRIRRLEPTACLDPGVYEIAARPHTEVYKKGHGVENLVHDWLGRVLFRASYKPAVYKEPKSDGHGSQFTGGVVTETTALVDSRVRASRVREDYLLGCALALGTVPRSGDSLVSRFFGVWRLRIRQRNSSNVATREEADSHSWCRTADWTRS